MCRWWFLFLFVLCCSGTAVGMEGRATLLLNGDWGFITDDSPGFSRSDLDHSDWSVVTVPADWRSLGINHSGYAWYRTSFSVSASDTLTPRFLRFDSIMDEGEVWLNGVRLLNPDPALCELLKDRQFGSFGYQYRKDTPYRHNHPFEWPYMFPVSGILKEGENSLAVRVLDEVGTAQAGIVGDVYLVLTKACYVSNVKLIPGPEVSPQMMTNFTFEVTVTNEGPDFQGWLHLSVFKDDLQMPSGDVVNVLLGSGDQARLNLTWNTRPRFEKYLARINLVDASGVVDSVEQRFHGTIVEVRGDQFYVNGERFIFKGVNFAYPKDFDTMMWIGLNGIRVDRDDDANASFPTWIVGPSPSDVDLALEYGIVHAPLVGFDSCDAILNVYDKPDSPYNEMEMQLQVLAMWDEPNVIIWNVANEMHPPPTNGGYNDTVMELYLKTRYEAAHSLDPYHRPVSYSSIFWLQYSFWQDIVGTNVYGRDPDIVTSKPLFMTEWGSGQVFLRKSWTSVVLQDEWGVMGAAMWPGAGVSSNPGDVGINDPDPALRDTFRWALRDFLQDMSIQVTNVSGEMFVSLGNRRFYDMEDTVATITLLTTGQTIRWEVGAIKAYQTANTTIRDAAPQPVEIRVDYTTHGGLKAFCNLSTLTNPDHTYPRETTSSAKYFDHGMSFTLGLTEPCHWNVTVLDPDGQIVDIESGQGESVSMTWNVTERIKQLTPGWYTFILDLRDMAGNQLPPVPRYRYPLEETAYRLTAFSLLVVSSPLIRSTRQLGCGSINKKRRRVPAETPASTPQARCPTMALHVSGMEPLS